MKKICIIISVLFTMNLRAQTVNLTKSNLPIIVINTNGITIPDEPKINANMKVFWKGDGVINATTDVAVFDGKIGIELRGSTSQDLSDKKPFSIEVRDASGNDIDTSLIGMPKESDWALVAPYSDKSLIRDALIYGWARSFMAYAPRTKFCEVVVNGSYQGVYVLTEKIKRGKNRVNIAKIDTLAISGDALTGGYILKIDKETGAQPTGISLGFSSKYTSGVNGIKRTYFYHYPKPEDIKTAHKTYIQTAINEFEDVMRSANFADLNNGYAKYIDVNTFVDFVILNEISRNVDGYRLSTFLYKDKNSVASKFKMGPVWDFNIALGNADYCKGFRVIDWAIDFNKTCPDDGFQVPFWMEKMFADPEFKKKMKSRWTQLRTKELSDANLKTPIDSLTNLLAESQVRNFQTWKILGKYVWPNPVISNTYKEEIDYLRIWLTDRVKWMDNTILTFPTAINEVVEQANVRPNPSVSGFNFDYALQNNSEVKILIYNQLGQNIYLSNVKQAAGQNQLFWNEDAPRGIYFYEILIDGNRKMAGKILKE